MHVSSRVQSPQVRKRAELIALALIFLVALGLRLANLDSMEFKGDEAFNLMKARQLARLERFPLTSATSSTGVPEPPIFMYLLALPIVVSDDAVFVTGAIAVLNALAVFPCYLLVRRHIAPRAALMAAAFYAVNPWQILYSRKIWTQNLLPFFALLFLLCLFEAIFRDKPRLLVVSLGLLALTLQLHLSAAFLLPFTLLFLLWQRRRVPWRQAAIGAGLASLLFLPYLAFLALNRVAFLEPLASLGGGPYIPRATGLFYPLQLVTTHGIDHVSLLFSSYSTFAAGIPNLAPLDYLAGGLLVAGLVYALLQPAEAPRALAGYAGLSIGFVLASNIQIFPHYYNALLPILFILASLPVAALIGTGRKLLVGLTLAAFTLLVAGQLVFSMALLDFLAGEDCIWGEYGPPYRVQVSAVANTLEAMAEEGAPITLEAVHERASGCVNWDILATQYLYERLRSDPGGLSH